MRSPGLQESRRRLRHAYRVMALVFAVSAVFVVSACPGYSDMIYSHRDHGVEHRPTEKDLGGQGIDKGLARFDMDSPLPDIATPDSMAPLPDVNPGLCSPAGTPKACDPVTSTGCLAGSCYLLKTVDLACVCPKGTKLVAEPCMTTTDCVPGYGCAGTVAPGSCRRYCRPGGGDCAATETCKPVNSFPTVGMCIPNN